MDSIVLFYDKHAGKCVKGKVTYYENWFEDWKNGTGSGEIMSVEFDKGDTPAYLSKDDIRKVYDQVDKKFKEKMGVSYEEFCEADKPSYEQVMRYDVEKKINKKESFKMREGDLIFYNKDREKVGQFHVTSGGIK